MSDAAYPIDLAARRLGGMVLAANDEFFAPKESLLLPHEPVFDAHRYSDRGKEMDGWETRRRRTPGNDWCIVRLGVAGVIRRVVVDTTHFRGNYPEACTLEGVHLDARAAVDELTDPSLPWAELLPRSKLLGDTDNTFDLNAARLTTHVRLHIHPDGGVARLRFLGEPLPDLRTVVGRAGELDLAALANGGQVIDCSDRFFSAPTNLLMVGDSRDMHDGWETRRRRGPGHDWVVVALGASGRVDRVEVDTTNFKGNYPESCSIDGCAAGSGANRGELDWRELVPRTKLAPHARHVLAAVDNDEVSHVRLNIYPDGGVARLRIYGQVTDEGWRRVGVRRLDALPEADAEQALLACCGSRAWARALLARRPFGEFATLVDSADAVWWGLEPDEWRKAFAAHPRIGEAGAGAWSAQEQAGSAHADAASLEALAEANRAYEQRFGHVFLICATGKSMEEMLAALRERLDNDPAAELHVAAEEQRRITRLRLDKLMRPGGYTA